MSLAACRQRWRRCGRAAVSCRCVWLPPCPFLYSSSRSRYLVDRHAAFVMDKTQKRSETMQVGIGIERALGNADVDIAYIVAPQQLSHGRLVFARIDRVDRIGARGEDVTRALQRQPVRTPLGLVPAWPAQYRRQARKRRDAAEVAPLAAGRLQQHRTAADMRVEPCDGQIVVVIRAAAHR